MERVVPVVRVADGKLLTLLELSRSKEAAIQRHPRTLLTWIESGVSMQGVIVHLPHLRIGKYYYSGIHCLRAFLEALQDITHANTAKLADQKGPPVVALKGDVFRGM